MLTDAKLKKIKPKNKMFRVADVDGLYAEIRKTGRIFWRFRYYFDEKEKTINLGRYPLIGLKDARIERDKLRLKIHQRIDPIAEKQEQKEEKNRIAIHAFSAVMKEWYEKKQKPTLSAKTMQRTEKLMNKDIRPYLGEIDIRNIKPIDILECVRKVEQRGAIDLAYKTMTIISQVMRYAVSTCRCERDLTIDLKGALTPNKANHYPAITKPSAFAKLLVAIENYVGSETVRNALHLHCLLFQRPGEIRKMEWQEVDIEKALWEIPAPKMKMRQPHIVPLSKQAIKVIKEQQKISGDGHYVLPSQRSKARPMSDNTVNVALRTLGYDRSQMVAHGFRATARTLLDEELEFRVEWIEQQLAHAVKDHLGMAYNRTKHLKQRTQMMQAWADYLDELRN